MATIRDKPGHIAASDSSRTSYKPPFLRWWVTEEKFGPLHSIQAIENEGHIEMRVGQVYRQSLQMAHFIANRCHIPNPSVKRRPAPETSSSKSIGCRPPRHIHNPLELMLFARWHGQRIDTVFIFYRKVRPCSEQHRPDTEASQIAEVHLSDPYPSGQKKGQGQRTYRRSRLDASLSGCLPPGRIFAESFQDTSGRACAIESLTRRESTAPGCR